MKIISTCSIIWTLLSTALVSCSSRKERDAGTAGAIISGIGTATGIVGLIKDFIKTAPSEDGGKGRYIRFYNFGNLAYKSTELIHEIDRYSRHCPYEFTSMVWANPIKTQKASAKWDFDGSLLVTNVRNRYGDVVKHCLDIYEDLWLQKKVAKLTKCTEYEGHGWFLKVHDTNYAEINGVKQFLFSIHPESDPDNCLTANTVVHCNEHKNLHYTWESGHCRMNHPFTTFFLEKCTGCNEQSFFVDLDYFSSIRTLANSVGGTNLLLKRSGKKCRNNEYYFPYANFPHYHHKMGGEEKSDINIQTLNVAVTSRGYPCATPCETKGYSYHWCYYYDGWDYCSKRPLNGKQLSTYGNICSTTCDNHYSLFFTHCRNAKTREWEKCGNWINDDRSKALGDVPVYVPRSVGNKYCEDNECKWHKKNGYGYYYCYLSSKRSSIDWAYCSPIFDVKGVQHYDIYGKKCDSKCHRHSTTGDCFCDQGSSWEYCGPQDVERNCPF